MAASVLFIIPVLVIFIFTQRYFVESVTLTGSKG
jgi:ABC-type maltose transport system permease subunit